MNSHYQSPQDRVAGGPFQSSASLHPPFGTSFLREPLMRPRPATLWQGPPATHDQPLPELGLPPPTDVPPAARKRVPASAAGAGRRDGAQPASIVRGYSRRSGYSRE